MRLAMIVKANGASLMTFLFTPFAHKEPNGVRVHKVAVLHPNLCPNV